MSTNLSALKILGSSNFIMKSEKGFALIQVLVAAGVLGIVMMGVTSMMAAQYREMNALQQKLATMDLEKLLIASLADGKVCKYVLNNPKKTFDSTKLPQKVALAATTPLYTHMNPDNTPGAVVAKVGSPVSAISNAIRIQSIELEITEGSNGNYKGQWKLNLDSTGGIRSLKPVTVSTTLSVDDVTAPESASFTGCQGANSSLSGYEIRTGNFACNAWQTFCCPGTKRLLSGACTSDWGYCNGSYISGNCFTGASWQGFSGGKMCGDVMRMDIICAD